MFYRLIKINNDVKMLKKFKKMRNKNPSFRFL